MQFRLRGREFVIEKRLPDGRIRIKDIVTDERSALPEQELVEAVFENNAELLGQHRNQDVLQRRLSKTGVCDIACLSENDPRRLELDRRFSYVRAVTLARLDKQTPETLAPLISKVAARLNEPKPPSVITVWRWWRSYTDSGQDVRSLVPAIQARGNRNRRFFGRQAKEGELKNNPEAQKRSAKIAELLNQAIDEVYLKDQRFTVQAVYDALLVKIDDANQFRDSDDQLPEPKRSGVYEAIAKLDDYEVIEARFGKKIADEKFRAVLQGPRPTRPLERVECDHTILDLFVIDPMMMLPIGRAYLTWMMCVFTKMVLGFYISFNPPSYLTVMECLKHAIRSKTYLRKKFPIIRNDWNPYGIPEVLVVDNAREFHGRNLEDACHQLGIVLQFSQKGKPWLRPTIERSFRTLATQLLHQLPGTTFSNIFDRADYEPGKTAIVTPDTLDEIMHKWIADVYQVSPHRGIRDIPALRWEKGIAEWPPALPVNNELLDVALGYTEERVVSARGIELDNLFYNDDELALVRRGLDSQKKVIIKRNPSDLSLIHVYDQKHNTYLPVPAVDHKYTKGLTLYQHNVISRYVRDELKRKVDYLSLARGKQEIQEIVEREWTSAKSKNKTRKRLARYRGEGVQKRETIEPSPSQDKADGPRLIRPSVPHLLLPPSSEVPLEEAADDSAASNIESTRVSKKEPKLKLVSIEKKAEMPENGATRTLKRIKQTTDKKASAAKSISSAKNKATNKQALPAEELDMTGWSGDYSLPEKTIVPVLYTRVPVPATCKSLVSELLTAIGDPAAEKGSQVSQTLRLKRYLKACCVELLILDEFQHFQDRDSHRVLRTVSDWLKLLMDETGIPIVLVGLPYSHTILDADGNEQLQRRFGGRVELEAFRYSTSKERQDFRRFLNVIDENLPLAEKSDLADPSTALCIFEATNGVIGNVMKLIRHATGFALESNREKLTLEILGLAYEQRLAANNPGKPNPFGSVALVA